MTCIATDGKSMAGDGMIHSDNIVVHRAFAKVLYLDDGRVCGMAGDTTDMALLLAWLNKGAPFDTIPKLQPDSVDALILSSDGTVQMVDDRCVLNFYAVPAAIGSGREVARGAMWMGASPVKAVECAAALCTNVGGAIVELTPKDRR